MARRDSVSFWVPVKIAWAEARGNRSQSFLILAALTLGCLGLFLIMSFGFSVRESTRAQSRGILGADLVIRSRQPLSDQQSEVVRSALPAGAALEVTHSMVSMVRNGESARLAQVATLGRDYPYYGWIEIEGAAGRSRREAPFAAELNDSPDSVWISTDLALQLDLKVGGRVQVGDADFAVKGVVADSSFNSWKGFSIAPPLFLSEASLEQAHLLGAQSLVFHEYAIRLPSQVQAATMKKKLRSALNDSTLTVVTHEDSSEQITLTLQYLNDFLALISLCGLFLATLGASFLFRAAVMRKKPEWATLEVLGLAPNRVTWIFSLQLIGFSTCAAWIGLLLTQALLPVAVGFLQTLYGIPVSATVAVLPSLTAAVFSTCFVYTFHLPLLAEISERRSSQLRWLPFFVVFLTTSILLSNSIRNGLIFSGGLVCSVVTLYGAYRGLLALSRRLSRVLAPQSALRHVLVTAERTRALTFSLVLSLGIGSVLLILPPQVEQNLVRLLAVEGEHSVPSLFLFDIQEEQKDQLRDWARETNSKIKNLTPMIRARMELKNGQPFEEKNESWFATREDQEAERSRNRTFNLSFRSELLPSERLLEGQFWSDVAREGEEVQVSIEKRFAQRLKIQMGDRLTFDVLGEKVQSRVTSVRSVRWTSFEPGFFMIFQPNPFMDEAPKTYLASAGPFPAEEKASFQRRLLKRFPNVSAVDIDEVAAKLINILSLIRKALQVMGLLALLTGFFVFVSMQLYVFELRKREWMILQVLSGSPGFPAAVLFWEVVGLASISVAAGALLSVVLSALLSQYAFDIEAVVDAPLVARMSGSVILGSLALYVLFRLKLRGFLPRELLQDERT